MTTRFERNAPSHQAAGAPNAPLIPPAGPPAPPGPAPALRTAAASRKTNRKLLILSVLVVLLGGVVALAAAQMLTKHTQVLALARDVPLGATLSDDDLTVANVTSDPNLTPVAASDRSQVVGMVTQVRLFKGALLTRSQLGKSTGFSSGQVLVALPMKPGQYPNQGLIPGDHVLVVSTPGTNSTGDAKGNSSPDQTTINAVITDIGAPDKSTEVTVIDVRVDNADGLALAQLASTGNLAMILLPGQ